MMLSPCAGAAPLFLSERALDKIQNRKTKPATYAMDLNLVGDYWGAPFVHLAEAGSLRIGNGVAKICWWSPPYWCLIEVNRSAAWVCWG